MTQLDLKAIDEVFAKHERIAFHFSGGRDSTAALYAMRPYWGRMRIYHLDTGDQFPETAQVVAAVERDVGRLARVLSDVHQVRQAFGFASDLVPVDNQDGLGNAVSGRDIKIISRYECCARTLMLPMHQQMLNDGVTLVVRGQRDAEFSTPLARSGYRDANYELLFPIQDWSDAEVMAYLKQHQLPLAPYYDAGMKQAPECMGCTAWWGEGRMSYLKHNHPSQYVRSVHRMSQVKAEIDRQYKTMEIIEGEV